MIFHYEASGFATDSKDQLEDLLEKGWIINQISAIDNDACWMLLEKQEE